MDRKFTIALSSLAGSLMLSDAYAIGLGDIRLRSALNEPLNAEIKLVQVKDLSENEILVNLAAPADFAKAGVDRDFLLTSLRFRLDLDDPKNPKVVVTTQQPIREPFLNFLVEIQWPSGRLLREYTLLMDLPAFAESSTGSKGISSTSVPPGRALPSDEGVSEVGEPVAPPPMVAAPAAAPRPETVRVRRATPEELGRSRPDTSSAAAPQARPAPEPVAASQEPSPPPQPVEAGPDSYGPTDSSDTLWSIAQKVRNGGSIHQNMVAIQRMNPEAFAEGNINRLKKGQVLKLPSQEEIASISQADARAEVNAQNTAWKSGKTAQAPATTGPQLDATGREQAAAPTEAPAAADGQLKLVTPGDTAAAAPSAQAGTEGGTADVSGLQAELSVNQEELNRAQRENQELSSRIQDLDSQIQSAEKIMELQSSEMAAMQAKLAAEQQAQQEAEAKAKADAEAQAAMQAAAEAQAKAEAEAKAAAEAQAAVEAQAKADAEAAAAAAQPGVAADVEKVADAQSVPAEPKAETQVPAEVPAETAAEPQLPVAEQPAVETQPEPVVEPAKAPESQPTEAQQPKQDQAKPKPAPAKKPAPAPAPEPSLLDSLLNPTVLGGIAAVVLAVVGLFAYRRKSAAAREEAEEQLDYAEESADTGYAASAETDYDEPEMLAPVAEEPPAELDLDLDLDTAIAEEAAVPTQVAEVEAPAKAETADVMGEADIYISFGNFDKGESLLQSAIAAEPSRVDYRLKLLELYKEADNLTGFDAAYKGIIELDDDMAIARAAEMRTRLSGADASPFAFGVASAAAAAGIPEDIDMDFDIDAAVAESPAVAAEEPQSLVEEGFDLDFDLDATPAVAEESLDLDLGTDFAASADDIVLETVAEAPVEAEEAFSLDFDLDMEAPAVEVLPEPAVEEVALEQPATEPAATVDNALLDAVTADAGEIDEELDFLSDADESATKLDLARAYIDMGDKEGARDILAEVLEEGRDEQKREAQALLDSIG